MKHYGGWSFTEAYNLPVQIRHWFIKRLSDQLEMENKQMEDLEKSTIANLDKSTL